MFARHAYLIQTNTRRDQRWGGLSVRQQKQFPARLPLLCDECQHTVRIGLQQFLVARSACVSSSARIAYISPQSCVNGVLTNIGKKLQMSTQTFYPGHAQGPFPIVPGSYKHSEGLHDSKMQFTRLAHVQGWLSQTSSDVIQKNGDQSNTPEMTVTDARKVKSNTT